MDNLIMETPRKKGVIVIDWKVLVVAAVIIVAAAYYAYSALSYPFPERIDGLQKNSFEEVKLSESRAFNFWCASGRSFVPKTAFLATYNDSNFTVLQFYLGVPQREEDALRCFNENANYFSAANHDASYQELNLDGDKAFLVNGFLPTGEGYKYSTVIGVLDRKNNYIIVWNSGAIGNLFSDEELKDWALKLKKYGESWNV